MEKGSRGWSADQRTWLRTRDSADMQHPEHCQCQWHSYRQDGKFTECPKTLDTMPIEIHHIYPQSEQRKDPKPYGGENPYNGIALCAGKAGQIGHHDLLSPQMIVAKTKYHFDRNSYHDSLNLVREAEALGLEMHDHQYDGMLKQVARARTDLYLRRFPDNKFPYTRNPEGHTSLPRNGTIFDGGQHQ